jgi:lipopolysaccharide export LptBFGC system permease protein LptF
MLRRLAVAFAFAFISFTVALVFLYARNVLPRLSANGASAGDMTLVLLFAVPFTAAMTIPMSVLLAVLGEFRRLGANGTLAAARRTHNGVRRLVMPVLWAAVGVAALAFLVTAELVPRTNARLSAALGATSGAPHERSMTIGALRDAARRVESNAVARAEPVARSRVAAYEVEIQKKLALPAACVVLALAGMAIAFAIPRGGTALVIGASLVMFTAYYMMLMSGEDLADRLVVSPFVGMWAANALVLTAALVVMWWRRAAGAPSDGGVLLTDG